ncbi:MAG TPA: hypothetical protein VMH82_09310, partial [Myxococcota bacterium]|nr:hypothetical protein [Myxococcota bacterium]
MRVFVDMHWGGTVALREALLDRGELFADETRTIFAAAPPRENPRCRLGWATYEEDRKAVLRLVEFWQTIDDLRREDADLGCTDSEPEGGEGAAPLRTRR